MIFSDPRFINRIAGFLTVVGVLILLGALGYRVMNLPMFNITRIVLEPKQGDVLSYASPASIQSTLDGQVQGNFFTLDLLKVQRILSSSPWVRHVDITRLWPNGLLLRIEEHEPFALWNDEALINTWGEKYLANRGEVDRLDDLPQFFGPDGSEHLVVQRYAELVRWLSPISLSVKELGLSDRYSWRILLDNNITVIIGRDPGAEIANPYDGMGAMSFAETIQRFVRSWPALLKRIDGRQVERIDLRYTRGFAVTFADTAGSKSSDKP
ncbi:cell division protein FtsQ/DivIB [Oligella urethralis]|uniref:Cell division protein FtsQ n=2 Tax=Oligella urethralis TaxID=90245 RepID=A0A095ZBK4_9BURK|nr:cell division protein FtsQ/DivIB [Oligella urethralis]AVL70369.1 cell division protein FtsQ [Oligella urethralis]KGF32155.1 cell division protein FtsQ [Oligella urethralis DNF00040]MDK6203103.1 cell division protein FtsQ/DivIB [Oligella urethralis]WOS36972.1 Cell division protein FtsQ [Oligella urethralis]SPY09156.1 Cell division protein FtsQ [Oligella urethralis]